jgi:leader peptidase (prepilin peptidase)/N-methyltransferase
MMEVAVAFLFGLLIGSFLNVCIYRLPRDLSVVRPRSYCPQCKHGIAWYDNVPVLSYAVLGGRCRHCPARIPVRYPVVELLTGLFFALAVALDGGTLPGIRLCVFSALLIGLVFADWEQQILPDEFTLGGTVVGLLFAALIPNPPGLMHLVLPAGTSPRTLSVSESLLGAVVPSFLIWGIGEIYYRVRHREGLGLGDVKMLAMIGAFLGLGGALATILIGSLIGSILGLALIFWKKGDFRTYELPFGVFLGVAGLFVAFWLQRPA